MIRSIAVVAATLAFPVLSHAAKFSDLLVVQEAAQTGMWTMSTTGTLPDGNPFPSRKSTVCATKAEVLESFDNPFLWNEKTGQESSECPTTLTTNTSTVGVASFSCPAKTIPLPGQTMTIPGLQLSTEFRRVGKNSWTVKTGAIVTQVTYQGPATASCVASR